MPELRIRLGYFFIQIGGYDYLFGRYLFTFGRNDRWLFDYFIQKDPKTRDKLSMFLPNVPKILLCRPGLFLLLPKCKSCAHGIINCSTSLFMIQFWKQTCKQSITLSRIGTRPDWFLLIPATSHQIHNGNLKARILNGIGAFCGFAERSYKSSDTYLHQIFQTPQISLATIWNFNLLKQVSFWVNLERNGFGLFSI